MELNNLRREWQQSKPADVPGQLDSTALRQLLARRSGSPLAKMRRNAWVEFVLVSLCLLGSVVTLAAVQDTYVRSMSIYLIILSLAGMAYFRRKLTLLARLREIDQSLRGDVARQLGSLRALVKLYYWATIWSLVPSLCIGLVLIARSIVQQNTGQKLWAGLGVLLATYLVVGGLIYLTMRYFTSWWLQRLYGQHLDRLEGQLRELDEGLA